MMRPRAKAILAGAKGVISVTANVAPRLMSDMVTAAGRGDKETAGKLDARLAALHRDLFVEANPIPVKWALTQMGLIEGGMRLPLTELAPAYHVGGDGGAESRRSTSFEEVPDPRRRWSCSPCS